MENSYCEKPENTKDQRVHKTLKTYKGYTNIYFCPECGKRFNVELKEDVKY